MIRQLLREQSRMFGHFVRGDTEPLPAALAEEDGLVAAVDRARVRYVGEGPVHADPSDNAAARAVYQHGAFV